MMQRIPQPRLDGKMSHYNFNGTGRDSYIWKQNGGFFHEKSEEPKGFERGTFGGKRKYIAPNSTMASRPIHYQSNGTGRDSYIKVNDGGLSSTGKYATNFIRDLRGYSQIRYANQDDFLAISSTTRPKSAVAQNQMLRIGQARNVERLAQPKVKEDPYAVIRTSSARPTRRISLSGSQF